MHLRHLMAAFPLTLVLGASPARAHAILIASTPPIGGAITAGHVTMQLRFNSRIDRPRSRVTLNRPDTQHTVLALDPTMPPDVLSATADLAPGPYTLRWQVLAVDGHITRGDVAFMVVPAGS